MREMELSTLVRTALAEDLGPQGDLTSESLFDPSLKGTFLLRAREPGVLAGMQVARAVYEELEPGISFDLRFADGDHFNENEIIAKISGPVCSILQGERVMLNFMQRLCAIATRTRAFVDRVREVSTHVQILDTRKTTPCLRQLEKQAVLCGGGRNHRFNLSDGVMIKDNHRQLLKEKGLSIRDMVDQIRDQIPHTIKIEIEIDSLQDLDDALESGAEIILLDNMDCVELKTAVELCRGRVLLEASGGVKLETIEEIARTGVDFISVGSLTHGAGSLDLGLDLE